jgi:hypothetical protein
MLSAHLSIHEILLEEREGVSESSSRTFRDNLECFLVCLHSLSIAHIDESLHDILESDFPEVESECP